MRASVPVFLLSVTLAAVGGSGARGQEAPALEVTASPETVRPGGVVLLRVGQADRVAEGEAFGRTLAFWPEGDPPVWHALAGVPLTTEPGPHRMRVTGPDREGRSRLGHVTIRVAAPQFETRRLRVDPRFVNPPAAAADRIAREAATLAALFKGRTPGRAWRGAFLPPVPGEPTSSFGRLTVLNGRRGSRHLGADFRAAEGTPVRAPNAGIVALADDYYFSGRTVVIDHGEGLYSLLAHLVRLGVTAGQPVARGDLVGDSGATGRVTGPHLHWAVRLGGDSVDPVSLMKAVAGLAQPREETPP